MQWNKLGRVYVPDGSQWWARRYAHLPTADLQTDRLRVYFAGLDKDRFGRIGYVDIARDDPMRVIDHSEEPIFDLGALGTFDDSGVNPSCLVRWQGQIYLYYIGWRRQQRTPYALQVGLAVVDPVTGFAQRVKYTPVLATTDAEPIFRSAITVVPNTDHLLSWYVSAKAWIERNGKLYPQYHLRHATSDDGIVWHTHPQVSIELEANEYGLGRPWVMPRDEGFEMWYSIRSFSQPYRMGYATSLDGIHWTRMDDQVGINRSTEGWDSEMVCYANIIDVDEKRYMFYNGNSHGATGFGCALLEI